MMMQVKCRFINIGVDMVMRKWLQQTAMMGRGVVETAMQIKPDHDCLQETLPFYTALISLGQVVLCHGLISALNIPLKSLNQANLSVN